MKRKTVDQPTNQKPWKTVMNSDQVSDTTQKKKTRDTITLKFISITNTICRENSEYSCV